MTDDWPDETDNPLYADDRNFYKVEKWTKDGMKVDRMLYAGNNLDEAREIFAKAVKHRPRIRLTIRQRTRVLKQWPAIDLAHLPELQRAVPGRQPDAHAAPDASARA
jgi:hypothetical protein